MLIPQYTIRWLLTLTAACAVAFSIFGLAVQGSPWAQGVSIGIVSLVVVLLIHAFLFTLVWVVAPLVPVFLSVVFPSEVREYLTAICRSRWRQDVPGQSPFVEGPGPVSPAQQGTAASDKDHPLPSDARE